MSNKQPETTVQSSESGQINPGDQLKNVFMTIQGFIDELDEFSTKGIEHYPDLEEDLERLQDLILEAKDSLTQLSESVE